MSASTRSGSGVGVSRLVRLLRSVEEAAKFLPWIGIRFVNPARRVHRREAISSCLRMASRNSKTMQGYRCVNVWSIDVVPTVDVSKNRIIDEEVRIDGEIPRGYCDGLALYEIDNAFRSGESNRIDLRVADIKGPVGAKLANRHAELRAITEVSESHAEIDRHSVAYAAPCVVTACADRQNSGVANGLNHVVPTSDVGIQSEELRDCVGMDSMLPAIPSAVHPSVSGAERRDCVEMIQLGSETLTERALDIHGDFLPNV